MEEKYCPKCKEIVKVQKNAKRNGVQRYKCKKCKSTFSAGNEYYAEIRYMAVKFYSLGLYSYRIIAMIFGISKNTVLAWVNLPLQGFGNVDKIKTREIAINLKKEYEIAKEIDTLLKLQTDTQFQINKNKRNVLSVYDEIKQMESEITYTKLKIGEKEELLNTKKNYNDQSGLKSDIARLYDKLRLEEKNLKKLKTNDNQNNDELLIKLNEIQNKVVGLQSQCHIEEQQYKNVFKILEVLNKFISTLKFAQN